MWIVVQLLSCGRLCNPMDYSMPGFPVLHHLPEFAQIHVHWVGDAIQTSCPLSSPSSPTFSLSQHQGLFQWVSFSNQVAKVLELQLQHQSFQWIFRVDFFYDWLIWSPWSPRDCQESSPTPQFRSINSSALSLVYGPAFTSIKDYWQNHSFVYTDLCQHSNVRTGPWWLSTKELILSNCGAGEDSWESLGLSRRSNQSILKEINPEYSLERLMLKLQYFGHLMQRASLLEETLILGKIEGKRRRKWQRMRWLDSITNLMDMNLSKLQEIVKDRGA